MRRRTEISVSKEVLIIVRAPAVDSTFASLLIVKPDEEAEERRVVDSTCLSRRGIRGRWLELPKAPESQLS